MNNGKTYLKDWFDLENSTISICKPSGEIFKEEKVKEGLKTV